MPENCENAKCAEFVLPYPPSVNHYWGTFGKRRFITKKGLDFRAAIIGAVAQSPKFGLQRVGVRIVTHAPDRRRRDLDNVLKSLLDALQHAGVFADDEQIDELTVFRGELQKGGAISLKIYSL